MTGCLQSNVILSPGPLRDETKNLLVTLMAIRTKGDSSPRIGRRWRDVTGFRMTMAQDSTNSTSCC
jgi:hypothetical protein